jgi:hypothetical protein
MHPLFTFIISLFLFGLALMLGYAIFNMIEFMMAGHIAAVIVYLIIGFLCTWALVHAFTVPKDDKNKIHR